MEAIVYGAVSAAVADVRFDLPADARLVRDVGAPDAAGRRAWAVALPPDAGIGRVGAVAHGGGRLATVAWTSDGTGTHFVANRPDGTLVCGLLATLGPLAASIAGVEQRQRLDMLTMLAGLAPEPLAGPLVDWALSRSGDPMDDPSGTLAAVNDHETTACG